MPAIVSPKVLNFKLLISFPVFILCSTLYRLKKSVGIPRVFSYGAHNDE